MARVAVLGGSKGCARAMVVQSLSNNANHEFKLLIRNPNKLEESYTKEQLSKVTIIEGDALDVVAVKETIRNTDVVIFSVGSGMDIMKRKMLQPGLCKDAMTVLLEAMSQLSNDDVDSRPKHLVAVSTTGLDGMKEVPFLLQPLYKFLLHEPHQDKLAMERLIENNEIQGLNWIIVRPSLLTDGQVTGKYRANVGISGYTISRDDVGHFLWNQCVLAEVWNNKKVVVTY
ncbi:hypothetical protein BDF20DRAFT_818267 [Mycotypha africana]|uniref:uncharacterized protein n=1 Tax=Mycotypha africana TaxID=64632 RepID=UPI0022FFDEBA|nr:uncharacterized protein BDF20DRAFT_818267 [Mycotypha africana]KAI8981831.1 hypothetical protein BDF20DRAFT_818267 [Mycotypha africana]